MPIFKCPRSKQLRDPLLSPAPPVEKQQPRSAWSGGIQLNDDVVKLLKQKAFTPSAGREGGREGHKEKKHNENIKNRLEGSKWEPNVREGGKKYKSQICIRHLVVFLITACLPPSPNEPGDHNLLRVPAPSKYWHPSAHLIYLFRLENGSEFDFREVFFVCFCFFQRSESWRSGRVSPSGSTSDFQSSEWRFGARARGGVWDGRGKKMPLLNDWIFYAEEKQNKVRKKK